MSYLRNLRGKPGASMRGRVRTISRTRNAGVSLSKRRRWYADDATGDDDGQSGTDDSDDGGDAGESDEDDDPAPQNVEDLPEWAQRLLSSTRSEAAENRRKLREAEEAKAAEKRRLAEEQGEYKKLWDDAQDDLAELTVLREARTARLESLKARNEKRIGELAKDVQQTARDILETAGTDDPDKVSALLDKIIPTLGAGNNPPPNDGGNKGDGRKQAGSTQVKLNKVSY